MTFILLQLIRCHERSYSPVSGALKEAKKRRQQILRQLVQYSCFKSAPKDSLDHVMALRR
jgi:hypothetical protein